jgi:protein ImuA
MYSIWVDFPPEKLVASAALHRAVPGLSALSAPPPQPAGAVRPAPEDLHPALWRAWQMGRAAGAGAAQGAVPSGYAELDLQLPGGGWPARTLTELLLPQAGVGEMRLLAPALAALQGQGRGLMWFDPPAEPCAWALGELGVNVKQLVLVRSRQMLKPQACQRVGTVTPAADVLWALEHALKSGHLGAALAWLPARLPADALRRLQLAAQAHDGPVFLFRGEAERARPSPAPLRLLLNSAGPDALQVRLLKRRGPPPQQPLWLELPPVLSPAAFERAMQLQAATHTSDFSATTSFES